MNLPEITFAAQGVGLSTSYVFLCVKRLISSGRVSQRPGPTPSPFLPVGHICSPSHSVAPQLSTNSFSASIPVTHAVAASVRAWKSLKTQGVFNSFFAKWWFWKSSRCISILTTDSSVKEQSLSSWGGLSLSGSVPAVRARGEGVKWQCHELAKWFSPARWGSGQSLQRDGQHKGRGSLCPVAAEGCLMMNRNDSQRSAVR